jgi:hypothetical protein
MMKQWNSKSQRVNLIGVTYQEEGVNGFLPFFDGGKVYMVFSFFCCFSAFSAFSLLTICPSFKDKGQSFFKALGGTRVGWSAMLKPDTWKNIWFWDSLSPAVSSYI